MSFIRRKKRKSRFINLAEQLAIQNDIVDETMDSLLSFVSQTGDAKQRSDWDEIKKTGGQQTLAPRTLPRPKLTRTEARRTREKA